MPHIGNVNWKPLTKVFELSGWEYVRTRGDHMIYSKQGFTRSVVIPRYKNIPSFIIMNNLKTAQISREEFFKLLEKVK